MIMGAVCALACDNSYPDVARKIYDSFEKQTGNKTSIKSAADVLYRGKDKVLYPIVEERRGSKSPANAYFGGQMAYCMSKDALSMGNIRIIRNHLKNEINYKGDYLLVCEDSNLPNGYRILTELYGDESTLRDNLDTIKGKIRSGIVPLKKNMYSNVGVEWINKNNSVWKMWLACAIAYDFETNCAQNMEK